MNLIGVTYSVKIHIGHLLVLFVWLVGYNHDNKSEVVYGPLFSPS